MLAQWLCETKLHDPSSYYKVLNVRTVKLSIIWLSMHVSPWDTLWTQSHDQDLDVCCTCHPCCNYCPINYICTCIIAGSTWYSPTDSTNLHKLAYMKWYCLLFDHKGNYWCGRVDSGSWSCLGGEGVAAAYTIGIRLALFLHTHCTGSGHVRINGVSWFLVPITHCTLQSLAWLQSRTVCVDKFGAWMCMCGIPTTHNVSESYS